MTDQMRTLLICLLLSGGIAGAFFVRAADTTVPAWYLLEFSSNRPACENVAEGARCISTTQRTTLFEIRDGERIEMPVGSSLPPVWVEFNNMWGYAPGMTSGVNGNGFGRSIQLDTTPMGVRLMIEDENRQYLQSVPVGDWVELEQGNRAKLWVRVSVSQS